MGLFVKFLCLIALLNFSFSLFPIQNYTKANTRIKTSLRLNKRSDGRIFKINLTIEKEPITLCIRVKNEIKNALVNASTKVLFLTSNTETENKQQEFNLSDFNLLMVDGYAENYPQKSSVRGYLDDNAFYGRIYINNRVYYVEKLTKYFSNTLSNKQEDNALIYQGSIKNLAVDFKYSDEIYAQNYSKNIGPKIQYMQFNTHTKYSYSNSNSYEGYVCNLLVVIDASFLKYLADGNVNIAISIVLSSLENAETIFRSTDFDGDEIPDNIGFRVSALVVEGTRMDFGVSKFIRPYTRRAVDGRLYLAQFAKYPYLTMNCLGIGFTAQPFLNKVIGLSFTAIVEVQNGFILSNGGICDGLNIFGDMSHNCLVVTYSAEHGIKTPQFIADLSLVHELGHSFGSEHDDNDDGFCDGFLMSSHTERTSEEGAVAFSPCSRKQMREVMNFRTGCFEVTNEPYCGNGIVEEGEVCDCGHPVNCARLDQCCIPKGHEDLQCQVDKQSGYECHPSQGMCCSSTCTFRDLSRLNLDCKTASKLECPCKNGKTICPCGLRGVCLDDECHSIECARLGLKECECHPTFDKNVCKICCLKDNRCLEAHAITMLITPHDILRSIWSFYNSDNKKSSFKTQQFNESKRAVETFEDYNEIFDFDINVNENLLTKHDIVEEICADFKCKKVLFKAFDDDDFCISQGELSRCNKGRCASVQSRPQKNRFPSIAKPLQQYALKDNAAHKFKYSSTYSTYFLICIIAFLLY